MGILALSADERVRDVRVSEDTLSGWTDNLSSFGLVSETVEWDPEATVELESVRRWLRHSLAST